MNIVHEFFKNVFLLKREFRPMEDCYMYHCSTVKLYIVILDIYTDIPCVWYQVNAKSVKSMSDPPLATFFVRHKTVNP